MRGPSKASRSRLDTTDAHMVEKLCPEAGSPLYAPHPMRGLPGDGLLCPDQQWLDHLAPWMLSRRMRDGSTDLNLINAGANKGFTAALMLQRFGDAESANFSNSDWFGALTQYLRERKLPGTMHICGVCCACLESRPPRPPSRLAQHDLRVRVHAFEPVKANFDWLSVAFPRFARNRRASASVLRAALGNQRNRTAAIAERGIVVGKENVAARLMDTAEATGERGMGTVPIVTLDDWMEQRSIRHVDLALFDAEGWDGLVLDGWRKNLREGRVTAFEFEATWFDEPPAGAPEPSGWLPTRSPPLEHTLAWLDGLGYACFFEYDNGCLAPASRPCHIPRPALQRKIQNIVCASTSAPAPIVTDGTSAGRGETGSAAAVLWRLSNRCVVATRARESASAVTLTAPNRTWIPTKGCGVKQVAKV